MTTNWNIVLISSTTYYIRISPSTISQHIIPLVINSLGDKTHVQTHTRHAYRHAPNVWTESSFGWPENNVLPYLFLIIFYYRKINSVKDCHNIYQCKQTTIQATFLHIHIHNNLNILTCITVCHNSWAISFSWCDNVIPCKLSREVMKQQPSVSHFLNY